MPRPRKTTVAACALVVLAALALAACGTEGSAKNPAREGISLAVGGIDYNVFITRQLNLDIPPDQAYYDGPEPGRDATYYGVFIQACNNSKQPRLATGDFRVRDNQGNEFEPRELGARNAFAYHPRLLGPGECIPEPGSVAEQGPTAGALLLFELPLTITENRPLELEIRGGQPVQTTAVDLDL